MAYNFRGKWALVTGAGKEERIGARIAEYFAREGANVYIHYRSDKAQAERVRDRVELEGKKYGVKAKVVYADLSTLEGVHSLFEEMTPTPDIVVNNAADFASYKTPEEDGTFLEHLKGHKQLMDRNIDVNMKSSLLVAEAAIYKMTREKKEGVIVFVADAHLRRGGLYPEGHAGYTASKSYIEEVIHHYAAQYGKYDGLRFLAIANGPIVPPPGASSEVIEQIRSEINMPDYKLKPWIGQDRVAEAVIGLINMDGANAAVLDIDGGRGTSSRHENV